MRKAILMMLLAVVSGNAAAEWKEIYVDKNYNQYADLATIHRTGTTLTMWTMTDYLSLQSVSGKSYLSVKSQQEFDCAEPRLRFLVTTLLSERGGKGRLVYSDSTVGKWLPVAPDTSGETFWKFACGTSSAQDPVNVGDWRVSKSLPGFQIASTSTGAGSVVGVVCNIAADTCAAYIIFSDVGCKLAATYPLMINSAVGAYPITTICSQIEGTDLNNLQVINEFDRAREALESGGDVGFVMPLASGQFHVIRFSTKGATAAIKNVMTRPQSTPPVPSKQLSREQLL